MAQLPPVIDKIEEVAEPARQFYVQKDGKFHIDLSGSPAGFVPATELVAANAKVVEFRDNNIKLTQEVEPLRQLKTKIGDLDIDGAKNALVKVKELETKGVKGADDITKLVTDAIAAHNAATVKPLQDQLAAIAAREEKSARERDALQLAGVIGDAFAKAGGRTDAKDYITGKAASVFKVVDGKIGTDAFSADKPGEPLSIAEWITKMTKESAFAFQPSSGSGAAPSGGGGGRTYPAGTVVLRDPSPQDLGKHAKDIRDGKVKLEYSDKQSK
jgi:hypothetical protein